MADEEEKNEATSQTSNNPSDEDGSDSDSVEMLVTGRERRKTAGNRYDRDTVMEEAAEEDEEDEVNLLFADNEDEEDDEFKSDEDDEDAEMSDDDGDDQGPNAGADDLEGESEIQNQAKAERAKKRKADLALTTVAGLRKKPKVDLTQIKPSAVPLKPSKRKERLTWVPGKDRGAGRTSLRKQTIAHREDTIARLKASEAHSKKLKALKEQRNKERAKEAPKELTQADRLAEAERVERRNAKSLNRWEAMEKKRAEEQAAKLAALKNRKLEGPVITWWSGKAKWTGPRLNKVGSKDATGIVMEGGVETKKRGRKPKAFHEQMAAAREAENRAQTLGSPIETTQPIENKENKSQTEAQTGITPKQITFAVPERMNSSAPGDTQDKGPDGADVSVIAAAPSAPSSDNGSSTSQLLDLDPPKQHVEDSTDTMDQPHNHIVSDPGELQASNSSEIEPRSSKEQQDSPAEPDATLITASADAAAPVKSKQLDTEQPSEVLKGTEQIPLGEQDQSDSMNLAAANPLPPPVVEISTRNLVVLEKFDDLSTEARQDYGIFYQNRKSVKPNRRNQLLCPITTLPVRYRDPYTGIGYANKVGYKKLQELKNHEFIWSSMLGCYVGRTGAPVARGVPDGFLQS